jgi:4-hydroxybenzoate polyprenyltransferase
MQSLRNLVFRLGHLGLLIASCGASYVVFFDALGGRHQGFLGPVLSFLTVFALYNFDHLRDSRGFDIASTPERARYMARLDKLFRILIGASMALYVALAVAYRPWALLVGVFYTLCTGLYVLPVLPGKRIRRLKDIPFFKNIYVPACWLILVLYSSAELGHYGAPLLWGMGFMFLRMSVSTATGDIRDEVGDRAANVTTIVTALGRKKGLLLLRSLNVFSIAWIIFGCLRGYWPMVAMVMIVPVLYILWLHRIMERNPSQGEFVSEVYDFEIISYGPIMILATKAAW